MKIFKKLISLLLLIQITFCGLAQSSLKNNFYIVAFNTVYSSNLIDLSSVKTGDLYLIVSPSDIRFDSIMFLFSKKKYSSVSDILDSLSLKLKIYEVVKNNFKNKTSESINNRLTDFNNYLKAYMFSIDYSRNNGPQVAYIVFQYSKKIKINFKILNNKCKDIQNVCKVMITSLKD